MAVVMSMGFSETCLVEWNLRLPSSKMITAEHLIHINPSSQTSYLMELELVCLITRMALINIGERR